mgnify:CR=1 FL=1
MRKLLFLLSFFVFGLTSGAWAQTVPTWSGGIGDESLEEMKARQGDFNLKFVFAMKEGDYVADVGVKIVDGAGKVVLEQVSDGPVFMTKLPAGRYDATLTFNGVAQTRKFGLGPRGMRTEQLRWQRSAADGDAMLYIAK